MHFVFYSILGYLLEFFLLNQRKEAQGAYEGVESHDNKKDMVVAVRELKFQPPKLEDFLPNLFSLSLLIPFLFYPMLKGFSCCNKQYVLNLALLHRFVCTKPRVRS